jgi:hypothetical protein
MRRDLLTTVGAIFVLVLGASGAFAQTAFVGATLFDGTGADPVQDAVVIVMGDRILEVGERDNTEIPDYLEVVDVSGKWIVPGLIDAHIHYFQSGGLYTRPDVIDRGNGPNRRRPRGNLPPLPGKRSDVGGGCRWRILEFRGP